MKKLDLGTLDIPQPAPESYASIMAFGSESELMLKRLGEEQVLWTWAEETAWLFVLTDCAATHKDAIQLVYDRRTEHQPFFVVFDLSDKPCPVFGNCHAVLHLKSDDDMYNTVKTLFSTIYELIFVHSRICFDNTDLHHFFMNGGNLYIHQHAVADNFSDLDTSFPIPKGHDNFYIYYICMNQELGDNNTDEINKATTLMEKLPDDADVKWTINVIPEKEHPIVTLLSCIR